MSVKTKPRVLNKRLHGIPKGAVYVGRPSLWGNPYTIGVHGTREEVVEKYRRKIEFDLKTNPTLRVHLEALRGKDLVCWCSPAACHADIILELANK